MLVAQAPVEQRDPQLLAQAMADGFVQCDAEMRPMIPPPDTSGALPAGAKKASLF
jgi:hypothetical protein